MSKIRQVLRCYAAGKGTKAISNLLDISRNTAKKYINIFNESGREIEDVLAMNDADLNSMFKEENVPENNSPRYREAAAEMPEYVRLLRHRGMTKLKVYDIYSKRHPDGYSRSRFCRLMQEYQLQNSPVAHIEHKAGDRMYVDFAGDKLHIIDKESGEQIPIEIFVAILPCSQLTFVEAVASQKKEDFIKACEDAFYFYGGTPQVIVPDNLKAAVTHPNRYESELNEDFASFANHYGCTVLPARVRRPKDKALVEGAVKICYRTIYPSIEDREFYDLEAMNAAIRSALEVHNNTPLTGRGYSRREQFEEVEKPCLGPINPIRFELRKRIVCTVPHNEHVRVEKHYYSVPHDLNLIGKKVNVMYNSTTVDIYYHFECIATHKRGTRVYGFTTNPDHLPKSQQSYRTWDVEKLLDDAEKIHPDVKEYLIRVIDAKKYPESYYKSCLGILKLGNRVGEERLIKACRLATVLESYSYQEINQILTNRQENQVVEEDGSADTENVRTPEHENIRGKEYFK